MKREKCVMCGKETDIDVETHIELRIGYIEGAGQLCRECYDDIYSKENIMTIVNPEECKTCKFFPEHCHYHYNEGINLSFLIANPDGTCSKRQFREEAQVKSGVRP